LQQTRDFKQLRHAMLQSPKAHLARTNGTVHAKKKHCACSGYDTSPVGTPRRRILEQSGSYEGTAK